MITFETTFVPPIGQEVHPQWGDRLQAATAVLGDEESAQQFVDRIPQKEYMLVAHIGDRAIGLQHLDWDEYDLSVYVGHQALSASLTDTEKDGLSEALRDAARGRYEDIF